MTNTNTVKVNVPNEAKYLSDFTSVLPKGIMNKGIVGCGGTTLALCNGENYIVVVPYLGLIVNKITQLNRDKINVLAVYGGITDEVVTDYLNDDEVKVKKIMVTYDSFSKVSKLVDTKQFKVLVDEYHCLLHSYSYRDKAIDSLLASVVKFDYVTYMSATPLSWDYTPNELQGLPVTEYIWSSVVKVKPIRQKTNQPYGKLKSLIENYLLGLTPESNGVRSEAMYIYMNSITAIVKAIKASKLKASEVRIICADTAKNESRLRYELGSEYSIGVPSDPEKKFNFITRSGFEGCDIYSPTGVTYIVTDCSASSTLLDISTDISQIVGRIRNVDNPFRSEVIHIYNTSLAELTEDEFDSQLKKDIAKATALTTVYNTSDSITREALQDAIKCNKQSLIRIDRDIAQINEMAILSLKYRYKEVRLSYINGLSIRKSYNKAEKYDLSAQQSYTNDVFEYHSTMIELGSFRACAKELCELVGEGTHYLVAGKIEKILTNYPDLKEIHAKLGSAKMKSLGYEKSKCEAAITSSAPTAVKAIKRLINDSFIAGGRYTKVEAKETLQGLYDSLCLPKKAKASDLNEYYVTKRAIVEGKEGTEIIRPYTAQELKAKADKIIMDRMFSESTK